MNLRTRVLVVGAVIGALIGAGAAYLYLREANVDDASEGEEQLPDIQPRDALQVTLGVLTAVRGIVGLGRR
jgi:hypothetical protein